MPATNDSTFDLDPPRRPSLDELGGAQKANHPRRPPDPVKHPTAEEWNHFAKLLKKLAEMVPLARVTVRFNTGTPTITHVKSMRGDLVAGDFTVQDHGDGHTSLRWIAPGSPGAKLPPTSSAPSLALNSNNEVTHRAFYTVISGMPAVEIFTSLATVGVDVDFVVDIH